MAIEGRYLRCCKSNLVQLRFCEKLDMRNLEFKSTKIS